MPPKVWVAIAGAGAAVLLAALLILAARGAGLLDAPPRALNEAKFRECIAAWDALRAKQCTPAACASVDDSVCQRCNRDIDYLAHVTCDHLHDGPPPARPALDRLGPPQR